MEKILALDISTHAGWALFHRNTEFLILSEYGLIESPQTENNIEYPLGLTTRAKIQGERLAAFALSKSPDIIVVEDTNLGKQRFSQRMLEQIHGFFMIALGFTRTDIQEGKLVYISSSAWRSTLGPRGFALTKEDKKNNAKLSKLKNSDAPNKPDKKTLGIRGKVDKKHQAVRYVNDRWGKTFKVKDNDTCDAICVGEALCLGAAISDGT